MILDWTLIHLHQIPKVFRHFQSYQLAITRLTYMKKMVGTGPAANIIHLTESRPPFAPSYQADNLNARD